ncbi:MAG: DNA repair exonuclease [Lachnospiraceae bacterium]|nr:DNA repair exonuclease [Lachnospiraceae bacterium]
MKIIHVADFHLGASPIKLEADKKRERKKEIIDNFYRLIMYAKEHGIKAVIIAGDFFDVKEPRIKIAQRIKEEIEEAKDISFFYLRGNHDEGVFDNEALPENLHLFSKDVFSFFEIEAGVCICGKEITENSAGYDFDGLRLDPLKINIVVLHGNLIKGVPVLKDDINIKNLENKNIDYLALGHIHKRSEGVIDERGSYAYSGCIEGRGFDEAEEIVYRLKNVTSSEKVKDKENSFYEAGKSEGSSSKETLKRESTASEETLKRESTASKLVRINESFESDKEYYKGFYVYDTESKQKEFVSFCKRRIFNLRIDLTGSKSENEALSVIKDMVADAKEKMPCISAIDIVRVTLEGKVDYNFTTLSDRVVNLFGDRFFYFEVKVKLSKFYNASDYLEDKSFIGEFIRTVMESIDNEEQRALIIETGLKVFKRKEGKR